MNRRTFLTTLAAAVAGASFDPERLLWIPGQRRHFDLAGPRLEPLAWRALYARIALVRQFGSAGFNFPDGWKAVTVLDQHGDHRHEFHLTDAAMRHYVDALPGWGVLEVVNRGPGVPVTAVLTHTGASFERLPEDC